MRKFRLVAGLLILILLIATVYILRSGRRAAQSPAIGQPYYPDWGNSGYDTRHYDLTLAVDVKNNRISGTEIIQAKAEDAFKTFQLDLRGLQVDSVKVNDKVATFSQSDNKLTIQPREALAKDALFSTTITYSGTPVPYISESDSSTTIGWLHYNDGIVVLGEPDGAPDWYAVNDTPGDKATYTFHVTVDKRYTVFANGTLQDTTQSGNQSTYTWDMDIPMASYLAVVNITPYTIHTQTTADGLPLNFAYPPELEDVVKPHLGVLSEMVAYLSSVLGPYPFKSYGMIFIDPQSALTDDLRKEWERPTSEYESQSFSIFFPDNAVDDSKVLHELAHQWFGDSVSLTDWGDLWLKEGFAAYSEWLWKEHLEGPDTIKNMVNAPGWYDEFVSAYQSLPAARPPVYDLYNGTSYIRGKMTLVALRQRVGEKIFFSILHEMTNRYRNGNITTTDFIQLASSLSGQNLDDFFNTWLYSDKLPALHELGF